MFFVFIVMSFGIINPKKISNDTLIIPHNNSANSTNENSYKSEKYLIRDIPKENKIILKNEN